MGRPASALRLKSFAGQATDRRVASACEGGRSVGPTQPTSIFTSGASHFGNQTTGKSALCPLALQWKPFRVPLMDDVGYVDVDATRSSLNRRDCPLAMPNRAGQPVNESGKASWVARTEECRRATPRIAQVPPR